MSDNFVKQRANAQFKKLPGVESAKTAVSEYQAAAAAIEAKTARLKGLRLARDAAELAAPPKPVPAKKRARKKKKRARPPPSLSLSDWLKNRHTGGHND